MTKKINNIIEALGRHENQEEAIKVLEELGTNCPIDDVRELASKALIKRNTPQALEIIITKKGKGVNDLSAKVAMASINEILALKDKAEVTKILETTIESNEEKEVQDTAKSVKALMAFAS